MVEDLGERPPADRSVAGQEPIDLFEFSQAAAQFCELCEYEADSARLKSLCVGTVSWLHCQGDRRYRVAPRWLLCELCEHAVEVPDVGSLAGIRARQASPTSEAGPFVMQPEEP
jgi:hypothetical protein